MKRTMLFPVEPGLVSQRRARHGLLLHPILHEKHLVLLSAETLSGHILIQLHMSVHGTLT